MKKFILRFFVLTCLYGISLSTDCYTQCNECMASLSEHPTQTPTMHPTQAPTLRQTQKNEEDFANSGEKINRSLVASFIGIFVVPYFMMR